MLTPIAAIVVAVVLFGALYAAGLLGTGAHRETCSQCDSPWRDVVFEEDGDLGGKHELQVCPRGHEVHRVQRGYFSRFAPCPSCRQRTLVVTPQVYVRYDEQVTVSVSESCGLCGHRSERHQDLDAQTEPKRGLILSFPEPHEREAWRQRRDRAAPDD